MPRRQKPLRAGLRRVGSSRERLRSVPKPPSDELARQAPIAEAEAATEPRVEVARLAESEVEAGQEVVDAAQVAEGTAELGSVAGPARKNAGGRIIDRLIEQRRIGTAIWTVYTDTARYFGDDPPTEAETKLQPDGTAITDLAETVRFIDDLAYELKARGLPRPHGRHLAIAIPIR